MLQSSSTPLPRCRKVARSLRNSIVTGRWSAGVKLPSTRDLAREFGVSLNTIHGALRELEVQDLVECRPRVGAFIKSQTPAPGSSGTAGQRHARPSASQIAWIWLQPLEQTLLPKDDGWGQRIMHSAQAAFAEAGYHLTLVPYAGDAPDAGAALAPQFEQMGANLAGVVTFVSPSIGSVLTQLDRLDVPWVTVNPFDNQTGHNFVTADNFAGGRLLGRCFAELGYERALVMSDSRVKTSTMGKMHGFLQGCMDADLPLRGIEYTFDTDAREATGYARMCQHLDRFGPPQGVFATGDFLALGAIRACRDRGVAVPEQTGIVGGTGLSMSEYAHPPLTVIGQPMEQMGQAIGRMLLEMIDRGVRRVPGQRIPCRMQLRGTLAVTEAVEALIEAETADEHR